MREFTIFKPGDKVKVVNDKKGWLALNRAGSDKPRRIKFTVRDVSRESHHGHAEAEECFDRNCLHAFAHPQIFTTEEFPDSWFSGFWFDPLVSARLREDPELKELTEQEK